MLLGFRKSRTADTCGSVESALATLLDGYSIEVMPRTAERVETFRDLLPKDTRIYIAHIDGTSIEEMVATAKRLNAEGLQVMPHFPARLIRDKMMLADWIARYQDQANVTEGLLLAGGLGSPRGDFHSSMQLMETGLFDRAGFKRLHVAGHPEGNRDIDPDGSEQAAMEALHWKQCFRARSDAEMAVVTQFCFEAAPVLAWADRLKAEGINLPIHVGVAGPAKLQTLIRYSIACGVGASLRVLRKRAKDVTKLLLPFAPDQIMADLAMHKARHPDSNIEQVHFFPLGGIRQSAEWATEHGGVDAVPANRV